MAGTHTVNYIRPPNFLRNKVGKGGLPQKVIDDAQSVITEQCIDIRPYLREQLGLLWQALEGVDNQDVSFHAKHQNIVKPLAAIKAHGGMFGYDLISEIAEIALEFTEHLRTLDPHVMDLLVRHYETMQTILNHNIRGHGGEEGYALAINLYTATQDYAASRRRQ